MLFSQKYYSRFFLFLCFIFFSTGVFANTIEGVRAGAYPDKTRVVIDLSSKPSYKFETLTNPDRLLIDLSNTKLATALPVSVAKSNLLTQVRKSTPGQSGEYRLVFDLTRPATVKAFTLAPSGKYKYRLVVDLTPKSGGSTIENRAVAAQPAAASKPVAVTKTSTSSVANRSSQPIVVAIDAGHGGHDPGSIGPGRNQEKKITLAIAKKVAANINATPGMRAVLTRSSDRYVSLDERSRIARRNKSLLLISIHADSFTSSRPRGASVFVLNTRRANTEIGRWVVKKEEQSQLLGGGGELLARNKNDKNVSQTVLDLQFSHSQTEGNKLALKVLAELKRVTRLHSSKPVYASLAVLKSPDIPSILVETGFISNPQEERLLVSNGHQAKLAQGITNAIRAYFRENPPQGNMNSGSPSTHVVKKGESLSLIAQRYGTSTNALMSYNGLKSSGVQVGQTIKIP